MQEIHKTSQNTRDQNKTLSVLWACTAPSLIPTPQGKAEGTSPFFRVALSACQRRAGKAQGSSPDHLPSDPLFSDSEQPCPCGRLRPYP